MAGSSWMYPWGAPLTFCLSSECVNHIKHGTLRIWAAKLGKESGVQSL